MTACHLLSPQALRLGVAAGALAISAPALALAGYPPAPTYEYADPAPPPVVFESDRVVQPVHGPHAMPATKANTTTNMTHRRRPRFPRIR